MKRTGKKDTRSDETRAKDREAAAAEHRDLRHKMPNLGYRPMGSQQVEGRRAPGATSGTHRDRPD